MESQFGLFGNEVMNLLKSTDAKEIDPVFFEKIQDIRSALPSNLFNKILEKISGINTDDMDVKKSLLELKGEFRK